jgi:hypothetical protein
MQAAVLPIGAAYRADLAAGRLGAAMLRRAARRKTADRIPTPQTRQIWPQGRGLLTQSRTAGAPRDLIRQVRETFHNDCCD